MQNAKCKMQNLKDNKKINWPPNIEYSYRSLFRLSLRINISGGLPVVILHFAF
jgi:hypothetical protein